MQQDLDTRNEYIKFMILLLFFGGLTLGAAILRPIILGQLPERTADDERRKAPLISPLQEPIYSPLPTSEPALELTPSPNPEHSRPSPIPAPRVNLYRVQSGDTLSKIAQDLGVTVEDLVQANNLTDQDAIQVGQVLTIHLPQADPSPTSYIVQWGDTLWGIARKLEVDVEALAEANGIVNPELLEAGMILTIPR